MSVESMKSLSVYSVANFCGGYLASYLIDSRVYLAFIVVMAAICA